MILPALAKKGFFFMLYPDSNIIGGNNNIMNNLTKWLETLVIYASTSIILRISPAKTPISTVNPDSYKYLDLFFLSK